MTYQTIDPANGRVVKTYDDISDAALNEVMDVAQACYENDWRRRSIAQRAGIVHAAATRMRQQSDHLAGLVTLEMGKLIAEAQIGSHTLRRHLRLLRRVGRGLGRDRIGQAPIETIPRRSNGGSRKPLIRTRGLVAAFAATALTTSTALASMPASPSTSSTLTYHSIGIDGVNIVYREAGPTDAPTVLLLHGYPSSSRMFDTLMPLLADRYHLVAPDYPGFGQSDAPSPDKFAYTFDHIGEIVVRFADTLGLKHYVLYIQDYGGPIGFRLALAHADRVKGIIVQNAVASEEGLGPAWDIRKAYWKDRASYEDKVMPGFTSLEGARIRHVGSSPHPERYNPDTWRDEFAQLSRPGQDRIQADLFWSYQTNVASYPIWQVWMRQHKPPMLVVWGKYDPSFAVAGAAIYQEMVPNAEVHILDAGHFALDEKLDEIASLIRGFLFRLPPSIGDRK